MAHLLPRPFSDCAGPIVMVLPDPALAGTIAEARAVRELVGVLRLHQPALALELGAPVVEGGPEDALGGRPVFLVGPASCNPAIVRAAAESELRFDAGARRVVLDAPTVAGIWAGVHLLWSATARGQVWRPTVCATLEAAVETIKDEVGSCFPSFSRIGVDWAARCAQHIPRVLAAADPMAAAQAWVGSLGDGHTWVWPTTPWTWAPYESILTGGKLVLWDVPTDSAAWRAGVRPGDAVVGVDAVSTSQRIAATPQTRPLLVGRRVLVGAPGATRQFEARSPSGERTVWNETFRRQPWSRLVHHRRLPSGAGYLRIRQWRSGAALDDGIDEALEAFRGAPGLVVDLRCNSGGNALRAMDFRDRFLRDERVIGRIQYRVPGGGLSAPADMVARPTSARRRWAGPVRFLTDGLTYSASEDALLGLAGQPHVQIIGEPSGGGSGRARSVPLHAGWRLSISSCLTFTVGGWCVEGGGIPVDVPVGVDRVTAGAADGVLQRADRGW